MSETVTAADTYGTRHVLVDSYAAIDSAPEGQIGTRAKDRIAQLLNDGHKGVLWVPQWLIDESQFDADDSHNQLFVDGVDRYSEKSHLVERSDGLEYFPLSQTVYFERDRHAGTIEPPQMGLSQFEGHK